VILEKKSADYVAQIKKSNTRQQMNIQTTTKERSDVIYYNRPFDDDITRFVLRIPL